MQFSLRLSLDFTWPLLGGMPGKVPQPGRCAQGPLPVLSTTAEPMW